MRFKRLAAVLITLGITIPTAGPPAAASGHRCLIARLHGSAAFPTARGMVRLGLRDSASHLHVHARNLRPLRGKPLSIHVARLSVDTGKVRKDGLLSYTIAGSGLLEFGIHAGSRVVLRGPRDHIVARGRMHMRHHC